MSQDLAKQVASYFDLVDRNHHTDAAHLLINTFGNKEERLFIIGLVRQECRHQPLTDEQREKRDAMANKYYLSIRNLRDKLAQNVARKLRFGQPCHENGRGYMKEKFGLDPNDYGIEDGQEFTVENALQYAEKHDLDPIW